MIINKNLTGVVFMEEVLHRGKNRSQGEKFVERPLLVQWEEQTAEASVIYGGQFVTIHLHRSQNP